MDISKTMKAALLVRRGRIEVRTVPTPRPQKGEALIRVRAVGICRSDIHYYLTGGIGSQRIRRFPHLLGHEPAGEVVALGPGVRTLRAGDRVAVEPAASCGRCALCRSGRGNICPSVKFLGVAGQTGAFAEYVAVPEACAVRVPRALCWGRIAALEPFAVGLHAVRLWLAARRRLPARSLVIGAGPIGLSVVAALSQRPTRVTACDFLTGRLAAARQMGARETIRVDARRTMKENALRLRGPYEAVFEAGGTRGSIDLALQAAAPGATAVLIGIPEDDPVPVDLHTARRKELMLINDRRSNSELHEAIRLTASGAVDLHPMITHRVPLERTDEMFRRAGRHEPGVIKVMIKP